MKKMLILVITCCIVICSTSALAIDVSIYNPSGMPIDAKVTSIGGAIIGTLQVVGTIFAICMLLYLGIRLMLASPSERADIKSRAVPYIVGAVMLFSIVNLLSIVFTIMSKV